MTELGAHRKRAITSERVKRGSPAYRIVVEKFGGLSNFCDATGFSISTVHNWLRSGLIPAKWFAPNISYARYIIEEGRKIGVEIAAADFIETGEKLHGQ